MNILVINCGSSSIKYQLIDIDTECVLAKGLVERIGLNGSKLTHKVQGDKHIVEKIISNHNEAIKLVLDVLTCAEHGVIGSIDEVSAVGHRVVHGGDRYRDSVIIDEEVISSIRELCELAPLHNRANLIGIEACMEVMKDKKMVAVFDTAFHQTMPEESYRYALPSKFYEEYKIRKYGFHGTSHMFVSREAADMLGRDIKDLKIITCHLGNGSSICAIKGGVSIDTTMGFTPLDGVIMGTRCGSIDPSIVTYLVKSKGYSIEEVDKLLNKESGVYGVSEVSSDFRDINSASEHGDRRATLALNMFYYSVKKYIGSYIAAMNGVDVIVFTAGVGENGPETRSACLKDLDCFGIELDEKLNTVRGEKRIISTDNSRIKVLVVPTDEELVIARETYNKIYNS